MALASSEVDAKVAADAAKLWQSFTRAESEGFVVEVSDGKGGVARTRLMMATSNASPGATGVFAPPDLAFFHAPAVIPVAPPPSHKGTFIDPTWAMGCADEIACKAEASNYYKTIHVFDAAGQHTQTLGSLAAWRKMFGFGSNPLDPVPDEIKTVYFNNGDLQLGRDMHCRQIPAVQSTAVQVACYVTNFINASQPGGDPNPQLSILLASQNARPFGTVAMTFSAGPEASVNYYVYDAAGAPLTEAVLDSQGPKAVPGVCIACHGGRYDSSAHLAIDGNFLPFDTSSFIFSSQEPSLSELTQREKFRKLNAVARKTAPVKTIQDRIDGWYSCGVDNPGCVPDPAFVPGGGVCPGSAGGEFPTCGWSNASVASYQFNPKQFYLTVPKVYCRTCHVAQPNIFNVENFTDFQFEARRVGSYVCAGLDMPDAEVPFQGFWANSQAQTSLGGLLGAITSGAVTCPH